MTAGLATWHKPPQTVAGVQRAFDQWGSVGQSYQPTITWQDTTSNATYTSASSALSMSSG